MKTPDAPKRIVVKIDHHEPEWSSDEVDFDDWEETPKYANYGEYVPAIELTPGVRLVLQRELEHESSEQRVGMFGGKARKEIEDNIACLQTILERSKP